jgi:hypothetical protein
MTNLNLVKDPKEKTKPLTAQELASRWHMSTQTLAQWRVDGRGPAFLKTGRTVIYRLEAILEWEEKMQRRNTVEKKEYRRG